MMNKFFNVKNIKQISPCIAISWVIINVVGCSSVVVQPAPVGSAPEHAIVSEYVQNQDSSPEPAVETEPVPTIDDAPPPSVEPTPIPAPAPTISSIIQSPTHNRTRTITMKGSGFDSGTTVEIYSASGKYIGKGILSSKPHSKQLTVKLPDLKPGKYALKVKNKDGRFSNVTTLMIPKTDQQVPQIQQCTGHFSNKPRVLYLCGGDADKLLARYLAQNSGIEKLPYSLRIKFYEKEKDETGLILQTVELGDIEQLFVESRKDFLERLEKRLKGHVAEFSATLIDDASKENADYFQCP